MAFGLFSLVGKHTSKHMSLSSALEQHAESALGHKDVDVKAIKGTSPFPR